MDEATEMCSDGMRESEVAEMPCTSTGGIENHAERRRGRENSCAAEGCPARGEEERMGEACAVGEVHSDGSSLTDADRSGSMLSGGSFDRRHECLIEVILERLPLSYVTGERTNAPLFGVGLGLDPCAHGALVQVLAPGGAADRSGMFQVGDIVVTVDGNRISGVWCFGSLCSLL